MKSGNLKNTVRMLGIIMSVTLVLPLVACNGKNGTETDKKSETSDKALEGFTLNVLSEMPSYSVTPDSLMYAEEASDDTIRQEVYERSVRVREKYGLEIDQTFTKAGESCIDEIIKTTAAQDDAYQMFVKSCEALVPYIEQGLVVNAYDIPNIKLDADYWFDDIMDAYSLNGYLPALAGLMLPCDNDAIDITVYNSPLAEDYGIENLYDVAKEGSWTYERRMTEMEKVIDDLNHDGKYTFDDRVGMIYASNNCLPYIISTGVRFVSKDADGKFVFDESVNETVDTAVKTIAKMLKTDGYSANWITNADPALIVGMIENKQALFSDCSMAFLRRIYNDTDASFGVLPLPKLSEEQDYYYNGACSPMIAVPSTVTELDKTGLALELIASESVDFPNTYYTACLEGGGERDAESLDMIKLSVEHKTADAMYIYDFGGFSAALNAIIPYGRSYTKMYSGFVDTIPEGIATYEAMQIK